VLVILERIALELPVLAAAHHPAIGKQRARWSDTDARN